MKMEFFEIIVIILLVVLLAVVTAIAMNGMKGKDTGVKWNSETRETRYVKIPSFTEIYFSADTKIQGFNFFNPSTNRCSMIIVLAKDGEVYYESDKIEPGYGLHEIRLNKTLDPGDYKFTYIVECCSISTSEEFNGVNFNTTIHVR